MRKIIWKLKNMCVGFINSIKLMYFIFFNWIVMIFNNIGLISIEVVRIKVLSFICV